MNVEERKFIREGMSEADVLAKLGSPDHKSTASLDDTYSSSAKTKKSKRKAKVWTYFPALGDSQTTTIVMIANNKVVKVERKVARQ